MKITTVLFDFDGTLADTLPVIFKAFKLVFERFERRTLSDEDIVAMFGPSEEEIIRRHFTNQEQVPSAVEMFYDIYREEHRTSLRITDDIAEMLQHLQSRRIKMGIVTGKGRKSLNISLQALGLEPFFDVTVSGDEVTEPKPHPEGVIKALDELASAKEEAVFVGDSDADIRAGQAAGLYTVGVQWLPTFQTASFAARPDAVYTSAADFTAFVREVTGR